LKKKIYAFSTKEEMLNFISNKKQILIALNAEKLSSKNSTLTNIINNNIGYPDGVGAVLALRKKGIKSIKIAGAEFWLDIIKKFHQTKSFYIIGGSNDVINKTILKLNKEFPEINICGFRNGYFNDIELDLLLNDIIKKKPDIVFFALGSPKQEYVMNSFIKKHEALYMGLGGSFDVYVGNKKRAPKFFQNLGLEWFYRLLIEPTRFKRQINLFFFAIKVTFNRI
jgi:UDP-N-acetyl-D-mannosaminouronate:lipid I N-acetyl-D-mannosaminouronosyltransferase